MKNILAGFFKKNEEETPQIIQYPCPNCGLETIGMNYCESCGTFQRTKNCCGKAQHWTAKFCGMCAKPFEDTASQPDTQTV